MSFNYDTERSSVPGHVTRMVNTFFSEVNGTTGFSPYAQEVLRKSKDSMSRDLSHAFTTELKTEIRKMEEQGKPVGDMSELKFWAHSMLTRDVDHVKMVGSIFGGKGWSGNREHFNVPLKSTTAEEVEAKNRAREEREAREHTMSSNYDTERSNVPDHVTRMVNTFFSEFDPTAECGACEREILDMSGDSISNDLSHAVTTALETEISKMEEQGKPVGDMSQLKFLHYWISPAGVDHVWMLGSINGEGWSGNEEYFKVPLEPTTAAEVGTENRAREEREAGEYYEEEYMITDGEVVEVEDEGYCGI
ncbi:hypothetical protein B9479_007628 [Cryptococcus floricola]|uniref:Uncharacterized protein n=1 Tax=Cryptococcus floricola TaxID=2591691 RepID=A0A5D3AMZ6_9TREE|nr:hypothetical protein B9479_007628 [Cryptococcus floricola]